MENIARDREKLQGVIRQQIERHRKTWRHEPRDPQPRPPAHNPRWIIPNPLPGDSDMSYDQDDVSVDPYEADLRDVTSEKWSEDVHRQLRAWTAFESEVQDRANTEYLALVRRNVARNREACDNEIQERKEKRRRLNANIEYMHQYWSMRRITPSSVATQPNHHQQYPPSLQMHGEMASN